jgi:hypothetical protein
MTLKFAPPKTVAKYALFTEQKDSGRTSFKSYDNLGSAKNAYHAKYNVDAKILESVDGEWFVLYDIPAKTDYNDLPWVREVPRSWRYKYSTVKRAVPMTREEYAEWRLKVERENVASKNKTTVTRASL